MDQEAVEKLFPVLDISEAEFTWRATMLKLILYPDKRLNKFCRPVKEFNEELEIQVRQMIVTMYGYGGIGLAANQVGYTNRVIIVAKDPTTYPKTVPLVLINPRLRHRSNKKQTMNEGCLSFPGKTMYRRRAQKIRLIAQNLDGTEFKWQASGLAAQCIQHELDHINGRTFLDK